MKFADGSSQALIWDSPDPWQRYSWVKPVRAVSAEIDPAGKHGLDADVLDDSRTIKPDRTVSRNWAAAFASLMQWVVSLVAAV